MATTIDGYDYYKGTPRRLADLGGYDGPFLDTDGFYDAPYGLVFQDSLDEDFTPGDNAHVNDVLEQIFHIHNRGNRPLGRFVGAMSPGDIIVLRFEHREGRNVQYTERAFVVQRMGFKEINEAIVGTGSNYLAGPENDGDAHEFIRHRNELNDARESR